MHTQNYVTTIYTDGSCIGNPGPGGWAALIRGGAEERLLTGSEGATTNNRMELMAAICALESLPAKVSAVIYTDSAYVRNGITGWLVGWKRKGWRTKTGPVKNMDLWQRLDIANAARTVTWRWVRAHAGNEGNLRVDRAAYESACRQAGIPPAPEEERHGYYSRRCANVAQPLSDTTLTGVGT